MESYERTSLWGKTLKAQGSEDLYPEQREILRSAFKSFREKAKTLSAEINRSMPDFTVHDITHIDALWDMADLVTDQSYSLTPTEAFVLGGAFLIHDLGMGLAAYQDGVKELRANQKWKDTIASILKRRGLPSNTQIDEIDIALLDEADKTIIRELHAKHASDLAVKPFAYDNNEYYLIDNPELRQAFGHSIGLIAYSHWWDIDRLENEFQRPMGVTGKFPNAWTIDLLKLACIIRIADITQIDDRRAPLFLQTLRKPYGFSKLHWDFQSNLNQPVQQSGRLRYTSKSPFKESSSDSFWVCHDTLKLIDTELNDVDALLSSVRPDARLNVFGVEGVSNLHHLINLIKVEGWTPIDTSIKVANVADLVNKLGGEQLYTKDTFVPIRELVQNSLDSIQARRVLDGNSCDWGDIVISFGEDQFGPFIEVKDNGVGMSSKVLTKSLLNFGESLWGSSMLNEELPNLQSSNFKPIGKYGIGFYSVFMLGSRVEIKTRRFDAGRSDTLILLFKDNIKNRPLLRKANQTEELKDGGTSIKVWVPDFTYFQNDSDKFFLPKNHLNFNEIEILFKKNFPAIGANLTIKFLDQNPNTIILSNDWMNMDPLELMIRLIGKDEYEKADEEDKNNLNIYLDNIRLITNSEGVILGRAFLCQSEFFVSDYNLKKGIITVGGIGSNKLNGVGGILLGDSIMASRDLALPFIDDETLSDWASEQAYSIAQKRSSFNDIDLLYIAGSVRSLRGHTQDLPFCYLNDNLISCSELENYLLNDKIYEIIISDNWLFDNKKYLIPPVNYDIFYITNPIASYLVRDKYLQKQIHWPFHNSLDWFNYRLEGLFIETIAKVWNVKKIEDLTLRNGLFYQNIKDRVKVKSHDNNLIEVDTYKILKPKM